jgi:hypothetical protein
MDKNEEFPRNKKEVLSLDVCKEIKDFTGKSKEAVN